MMRHSACRRALLHGDLDPEIAAHLEACDRCRAFARDLGQVAEYAQSMNPGPAPEELADRVIARIRHADAAVTDLETTGATRAPFGHRRPLMATMAVAAVLLLLVGVLAVVGRGGGDAPPIAGPEDREEISPLLTAAEHTLAAGTARVRLRGTTRVTVTPPDNLIVPDVEFVVPAPAYEPPPFQPPPPPDDSQMSPEDAESARQAYEAQLAEMRAQYEAFVEETRRRFEEVQQDSSAAFDLAAIPDQFSVSLDIEGEGAVRFPDQMRIDGEIRARAGEGVPDGSVEVFGVAVDGTRTLVRSPDGSWVAVPAPVGPLTPVLADADGVARLLVGATGAVDDLGEEELAGFRVRHYRFGVDPELLGPESVEAQGSVEVWVGVDDDIVHKIVSSSTVHHHDASGFDSRMESSMILELFDFGADVEVEIPEPAATSSTPLGAAAVLSPYEPEMATSIHFEPPDRAQTHTGGPVDDRASCVGVCSTPEPVSVVSPEI